MNSPQIGLDRLKSLLEAAKKANTEAEKAAIYSAMRWLCADLDEASEHSNAAAEENIERARWSIGAMLGYDVTNDHSKETHSSWALGAITAVELAFKRANG